jgi:hypothetical protein
MITKEQYQHRIGFLEGLIAATELYAVWKNGEQLVGVMKTPLKKAVQPYMEELERLNAKYKELSV